MNPSTPKTFSATEAISYGWKTVKQHLWFFIGVILLQIVMGFVIGFVQGALGEDNNVLFFLIYLVNTVVSLGLSLGMYAVLLRAVDGQTPTFGELFSKFDPMLLIKYFAASLLVGLATFVGLMLLIIPGIIISIRLGFFSFVFAEKHPSPTDALQVSWNITKGHVLELLGLAILSLLINLVGFLLLGVGLLVTIPISLLATAYAYRKLLPQQSQPAPQPVQSQQSATNTPES